MADLSITAANVLATSTAPLQYLPAAAGVTITQGQALYKLANNTLGLADSNGVSPANTFEGISLSAGSPGQPVIYVRADATFTFGATSTSGLVLYLSNTAGGITATYSDLASGSTIITLGTVLTGGTTMNLSALVGGVK